MSILEQNRLRSRRAKNSLTPGIEFRGILVFDENAKCFQFDSGILAMGSSSMEAFSPVPTLDLSISVFGRTGS